MQFDPEPYKLYYAWFVAFTILEPLVVFLNYIIYRISGKKTTYQIHGKTMPVLVLLSKFLYFSISFIKTMYIYKNLLHKPTFYPRIDEKDSAKKLLDYRDFIITFIIVQILMDVLWELFTKSAASQLSFIEFLQNYSTKLSTYSLVSSITFGLSQLALTDIVIKYVGDLEAFSFIVFGAYMIVVASF